MQMINPIRRKTATRILIVTGIFAAIAGFYFIVYPTVLFLMSPRDESLLMINKFKMLYTIIQMYKSDFPDSHFPTKADLKPYEDRGLLNNNDITLLGNPAWPAESEDIIVAVSRTLNAIPCPASYGYFFCGVRGWPSTDIPEKKIQLHANGKITFCPTASRIGELSSDTK